MRVTRAWVWNYGGWERYVITRLREETCRAGASAKTIVCKAYGVSFTKCKEGFAGCGAEVEDRVKYFNGREFVFGVRGYTREKEAKANRGEVFKRAEDTKRVPIMVLL